MEVTRRPFRISILHPHAALPAVPAMSDYSTTHTRAMGKSAFFHKHKSYIATSLPYPALWQDVLDHCRSAEVEQTKTLLHDFGVDRR